MTYGIISCNDCLLLFLLFISTTECTPIRGTLKYQVFKTTQKYQFVIFTLLRFTADCLKLVLSFGELLRHPQVMTIYIYIYIYIHTHTLWVTQLAHHCTVELSATLHIRAILSLQITFIPTRGGKDHHGTNSTHELDYYNVTTELAGLVVLKDIQVLNMHSLINQKPIPYLAGSTCKTNILFKD